jgi:hypothetical protein
VNSYRVIFTFEAPSDFDARQKIHEGTKSLGSMRIQNMGERRTLQHASKIALLVILWLGLAWCVWPHVSAFWSRLP